MSQLPTRANGSSAAVATTAGATPMPRSAMRALAQDAVRMRHRRLISEFVADEVSHLHVNVFRSTIDTLRVMANELEHATFLTEEQRAHLAQQQARYLATMAGISDHAALRLFRMLERLPDLRERQSLLDQLWDWFSEH
jgi:hypothetical protein